MKVLITLFILSFSAITHAGLFTGDQFSKDISKFNFCLGSIEREEKYYSYRVSCDEGSDSYWTGYGSTISDIQGKIAFFFAIFKKQGWKSHCDSGFLYCRFEK